jgi:ABC-type multidrug transport system ATPase subunit
MQIAFDNASKRYHNNWVLKNINYTIPSNGACSITGANGAGKSTLLQMAMGFISPTAGSITYNLNNKIIEVENVYKHLSFCSPAMQLLNEYTALEMLQFNHKLKPFYEPNFNYILQSVNLESAKHKFIKNFSSGMLQRLKLAIAINTNSSFLLLDEPTANLDTAGKAIYKNLIAPYINKRTILIASNEAYEYDFCTHNIAVL